MKKFFVGCNLHFEDELEIELQEIWPYLIEADGRPQTSACNILDKIPGGLLLEAPLIVGLQINFFSKLANRVLLRIKEFKVRDFPKMYQALKELKKEPLLQGLPLQFQVAAKESRLNNEKRILQILEEIFGPASVESTQTLYVRMDQDVCTVSLDSSGTHLHKRTDRLKQGEAPLRETLAAFCVRKLIAESSVVEMSRITLVDPMCGTGTLLREAHSLYQPVIRQDFSFLEWAQTPKILKSPSLRSNYPDFAGLFAGLEGQDRDPQAVERASQSLASVTEKVHVRVQDLFQARPLEDGMERWLICNPPYGERLQADFDACQLIGQFDKIYHPTRVALLVGENQSRQLQRGKVSLKLENKWQFKNGGLPVQLFLFTRPK